MIVAPSLLASNYTRLATEVRRAEKAGADWLHVDIMDGHFVPNLTFGPGIVAALRKITRLPLDVHLMCSKPETLLEPFAKAGADLITVHVELGDRVESLLWKLRALGVRAGLAVNPPTPISHARRYLRRIELLLVMTVNPGFGGQSFIHETVPKIQQAAAWRREGALDFHLEVDGGITFETVGECAGAGADTFVSGTGLFAQRSLRAAVAKLRRLAERAARKTTPSATEAPTGR